MKDEDTEASVAADASAKADASPGPPDEVFQAIKEDGERAGGPWMPPPGHEGAVGHTMFDTTTSKDGTVTVLLPEGQIDELPSQALVRIDSLKDKRTYLGAVVEGPFAEPDGLRADATPMVVSVVQGALLMPKFHGRAQVELIGERLPDGATVPPRYRPKPNSPVFALDAHDTADVLRIDGDLRLGLAEGFDDLPVSIPAASKAVLPRHVGILGTTGGGKSTTVSGLIAKAQQRGMAVILIDTEGEYCAIHEGTQDEAMKAALARRGLEPGGVDNTHIFHLVGRETANPAHPSRRAFSLGFSEMSPFAVQEILELSEAQELRFLKAYDIAKLALDRFGVWPTTDDERREMVALDEFETGYPKMTLTHLYDIVKEIHAVLDGGDARLETKEFEADHKKLRQIIGGSDVPKNVVSWRALMGKLGRLKRLKIFDSPTAKTLPYEEMLQPGRVSILDVSDTDSPQINNLVIAQMLRGIQSAQERKYRAAVAEGTQPTPAMIFIEEAHEFLSARRIQKMEVLFQQVARIARRGRKRWLGLVFITQLPQHLPDEVLGLINNWIVHKIGDAGVITRLKRSIGSIYEPLWRRVPSLAQGQAVVSFASHARPLQVSIDPTPCRLLMIE